ncbi:S16 family serine protease [Prosthecobacter sp.]|uniref:S16 family serine protease n=1 Tax=Prosthecobacter sp. TaxID=1965333 RepID=UPI0037850D94
MKKSLRGLFGVCLGMFAVVNTVSAQTRSKVVTEINFDDVFEWKSPCTMNSEQLEARLAKLAPTPGKKWYALDESKQFSQPSQLFNATYSQSNNLKYLIFGSQEFEPESVRVMWANGQIASVGVRYTAQAGETEAAPALLAGIGNALGAPPFTRTGSNYTWSGEHYSASASFMRHLEDTIFFVTVRPKNAGAAPPAAKPAPAPAPSQPAVPVDETGKTRVDLDALIDWKNPLDLTQLAFEAIMRQHETKPGRRAYSPTLSKYPDGSVTHSSLINPKLNEAYSIEMSMLKGRFQPSLFRVDWLEGRGKEVVVLFAHPADQKDPSSEIVAAFDALFGLKADQRSDHSFVWARERFIASYSCYPGDAPFRLTFAIPQPPLAKVPPEPAATPPPQITPMPPAGVANLPPEAKPEAKMPAPATPPSTTAAFKLRLTQVNGLLISPLATGEESGHVTKMTLTALPNRGTQESWLEFNQEVGGSMRRCLNEVSKLSQIRNNDWPAGYLLQIGFEDKYIEKDGPSAAVACALLVESALTGKKWDPAFAVTGDLNADGSVQPIGGVRAKIRGATNGSCKLVAVPSKNERAVADLLLLDGPAPLVGITVFGIKTFDDAIALATTERSKALELALADFDSMRAVMMRDPRQIMPLLRTPHASARLQALLSAAPECYSAKYLLLHAQGRGARTLSLGGSIEAAQSSAQAIVNSIDNDVTTAMTSLKPDEVGTSLNKLRSLRPMLDQRVWPYVDGITAYGDVIRSAILNPVRSGARYVDLVTKAKKAAGAASAAFNTLMNNAQVREELGL